MVRCFEGKVEDLYTVPRTHIQSRGRSVSVISAVYSKMGDEAGVCLECQGQGARRVRQPAGEGKSAVGKALLPNRHTCPWHTCTRFVHTNTHMRSPHTDQKGRLSGAFSAALPLSGPHMLH